MYGNPAFRPDLFAGSHLFITGGSSGIGLGIARRFASAGAAVSVAARNSEKFPAALEAIGPRAKCHPADVRDYPAISSALYNARQEFGPIDVLICAAAGNFPAPALGMSANGFKAVIDIDLLGTFNTCRAAFEHLQKPGASVVNISANQASRAMPMQSHVCAAKAGVDMLTRALALEWAPSGVRVNSVTPGPIAGTEGMRRLAPTPDLLAAVTAQIPLGRLGTTDDIANLCLFVASPAASFINGAVLVCDGGHALA